MCQKHDLNLNYSECTRPVKCWITDADAKTSKDVLLPWIRHESPFLKGILSFSISGSGSASYIDFLNFPVWLDCVTSWAEGYLFNWKLFSVYYGFQLRMNEESSCQESLDRQYARANAWQGARFWRQALLTKNWDRAHLLFTDHSIHSIYIYHF